MVAFHLTPRTCQASQPSYIFRNILLTLQERSPQDPEVITTLEYRAQGNVRVSALLALSIFWGLRGGWFSLQSSHFRKSHHRAL
jgi:hypothetical protein